MCPARLVRDAALVVFLAVLCSTLHPPSRHKRPPRTTCTTCTPPTPSPPCLFPASRSATRTRRPARPAPAPRPRSRPSRQPPSPPWRQPPLPRRRPQGPGPPRRSWSFPAPKRGRPLAALARPWPRAGRPGSAWACCSCRPARWVRRRARPSWLRRPRRLTSCAQRTRPSRCAPALGDPVPRRPGGGWWGWWGVGGMDRGRALVGLQPGTAGGSALRCGHRTSGWCCQREAWPPGVGVHACKGRGQAGGRVH